ncbi:MFS transporter [Pseudoduganella violaceinigra]|uniref:MFS transporter n=1 Tax=Pseudoduganella violaceinigra TaxID=246602 RepID=UPI00041370A8|nr:MFS transporter [Pseudoduganella violaceinigra]
MNQHHLQAAAPAAAIGRYRWIICSLLLFATTINYLDRQVLSLLAPALSKELGWSHSDYANIAAVFQFVYAVAMLFAGRVIDRIGTRRAFALAIAVWSLAAVLHAYADAAGSVFAALLAAVGVAAVPASVAGFMLCRAVLALGEAGNFPAAIKATTEYFPRKERSLATGIFNAGANLGAILAPAAVPLIAESWGWKAAFAVTGATGFVWLGFWLYFYDAPEQQKRLSRTELEYINGDAAPTPAAAAHTPSWFKLLACRQTWAFAAGKFLTDGVWWFFLFWLPLYMAAHYGLSATGMAAPLALLYAMTIIGSIGGGWLPSLFIRRGASAYQARMRAMLAIAIFPLVVLLAQPLGYLGIWLPVLLIGIGASAHQAWSANLFTTVSDQFPKHCVGSVVGIGGMAGGLGGVLITKVAGRLFDHYHALEQIQTGYMIMFTFCALAYLAAWCVMKALVPAYKEIAQL